MPWKKSIQELLSLGFTSKNNIMFIWPYFLTQILITLILISVPLPTKIPYLSASPLVLSAGLSVTLVLPTVEWALLLASSSPMSQWMKLKLLSAVALEDLQPVPAALSGADSVTWVRKRVNFTCTTQRKTVAGKRSHKDTHYIIVTTVQHILSLLQMGKCYHSNWEISTVPSVMPLKWYTFDHCSCLLYTWLLFQVHSCVH